MAAIIAILVCPVAFIVSVVLLIKAAVKKESKKPALIGIGASFAVFVICIALTPVPDAEDSSGSGEPAKQVEQQEEQPKRPEKPEYSTEFNPEYSVKCGDESIIVNVEFNAPDGAILELVVFDNDLNSFSDKQEIKDGKAKFKLDVGDDSTKKYAGLLSFQFNADSIVQPNSVKAVFGDYGEKMTGDNVTDANVDGEEYASLYAYAGKSLVAKSSVWSGEMKLE